MKNVDVIIIGAGPSAIHIANALIEQKRSVVVVNHGPNLDASFQSFLKTLSTGRPTLLSQIALSPEALSLSGSIEFTSPSQIKIAGEIFTAKKFVLAAGFSPVLPFSDTSMDHVAMPWFINTADKLPASALVIGGGPIGVALACYLHSHHCKVSIVTRNSHLLPREDEFIRRKISESLLQRGIEIETDSTAQKVSVKNLAEKTLFYEKGGVTHTKDAETIILAAGIKPATEGLNLKAADVYTNIYGAVITMEDMKTSSGKMWALGAVKGSSFSFDLENHERELIIHNLFEHYINLMRLEVEPLPFYIPMLPEFCSVGMQETEAHERHGDSKSITHEFATERSEQYGAIKLIARKRSGTILGVHIFAPRAAEMLIYFNLAMRVGLSVRDLLDQQHYPMLTSAGEIFNALEKWNS